MLRIVWLCGLCMFGMYSLRYAAGRGQTADRSDEGCGWKIKVCIIKYISKYIVQGSKY